MKNVVLFLDLESKKEKATHIFETMGNTYLVMHDSVLEDQNPWFDHFEHLKTNS
jgi:hypothetical protein